MSDFEINGNVLFERVVSILEQARGNIVKSVNSNMVIAYLLIRREIVDEIQRGEERAEYGKQLIKKLSIRLIKNMAGVFRPQTSGISDSSMWFIQTGSLKFATSLVEN